MVNIKNCFQERLRELRKGKGFTMEKMADELGISSGSISNYENGQRLPDIEVAAKIADYFGVSIDYLLGRAKNPSVKEDIQIACKVTGLTEEIVRSLPNDDNQLSKNVINSIIENLTGNLYEIGLHFIDLCKAHALRESLFSKFVSDKNLPISDKTIEERGEKALDVVYKDKPELLIIKADFDRFYMDNVFELKRYLGIKDEKYLRYLIKEISDNVLSDAFGCFLLSEFKNQEIYDYYVNYYHDFLNCDDKATRLEMIVKEAEFYEKLISDDE